MSKEHYVDGSLTYDIKQIHVLEAFVKKVKFIVFLRVFLGKF